MDTPRIPLGHQRLMPYFLVHDADAFVRFVKDAFAAAEREIHHDADGRVMHAELTIGDSVLMLGQSTEQWAPSPTSCYLYVADTDATHEHCLRTGCTEIHAPKDQAYGMRSSGLLDRWGNTWWLAQPL